MNRRAFVSLFVGALPGVLALLACTRDNLKTMTVDEVAAKVAAHDGKTYLFDANAKERYAKGHLPGARWVEYDHVTAADLPQDKGALLVFYCASEL